jgi:hypothetical protein
MISFLCSFFVVVKRPEADPSRIGLLHFDFGTAQILAGETRLKSLKGYSGFLYFIKKIKDHNLVGMKRFSIYNAQPTIWSVP